jgi:hypothetical protein
MRTNQSSKEGRIETPEPQPSPAQLFPGVRPEVASLLTELYLEERALWAEVERETAEFNRPRGIMGKLFGLRTSVG